MTVYQVCANIETEETDHRGTAWHGSRQVPVFYVRASSEANAKRIAHDIIGAPDIEGCRVIKIHSDIVRWRDIAIRS